MRRGWKSGGRAEVAAVAGGRGGFSIGLAEWLAHIRAWLERAVAEEIEHRTGFLWLPVAFALGIIAYFAASEEPRLWAGPSLALVMLFVSIRARGLLRPVAIYIFMAALGFSAGSLRTALVAAPMIERAMLVDIKGHIETIDELPARHRITLRPVAIEGIAADALPNRLRIGAPGKSGARSGDFVTLRARIAPPSEAAMPGGYDFRRESFFRGIGGIGYAVGKVQIAAEPEPAPLVLRINSGIDIWRNALTDRIARVIGGEAGALSAALVTGKRGLIPEATNEDLRASGLYHIVSISGLHMVLAAGVLFWLTRALLASIPAFALRHPIKKYAAIAGMVGSTFYCIFSGSEVATERSLIMTLVMLGAILVDRPALAMRNLAISALIVLAREPESLLGPSFQMSYAAVASLIAANQIWQAWRRRRPHVEYSLPERMARKILFALLAIAATTLVATLATAPFSAFHFHRLNPYGLIGNSLAIPLVSLIVMPSAVAGALLVPFGLDWIIWILMGKGVAGVLVVAEKVAAIENSSFAVARMPALSFALLVVGLLFITGFRSGLRWASLIFLALWGTTLRMSPLPDLLIEPSGRTMLVRGDTGRYRLLASGNPGRFTLTQWLPALGDNRKPDDTSLREGVTCDAKGCVTRLADGRRLALSLDAVSLREDCRRADIIVTPLAAIAGCEGKPLLAKTHFETYGASRVFLRQDGTWQIDTELDPSTDRPWRRRAAIARTLANPPQEIDPQPVTPAPQRLRRDLPVERASAPAGDTRFVPPPDQYRRTRLTSLP